MRSQGNKRRKKGGGRSKRGKNLTLFEAFRRFNEIFIPSNKQPLPNLSGVTRPYSFLKFSVISWKFFKQWEEAVFHRDDAREARLFDCFWQYNSVLKMKGGKDFQRAHVLSKDKFSFDGDFFINYTILWPVAYRIWGIGHYLAG